jgi:hypothetical protein
MTRCSGVSAPADDGIPIAIASTAVGKRQSVNETEIVVTRLLLSFTPPERKVK